MRIAIRAIAVLAAVSIAGTALFVVPIVRAGKLGVLLSSALGVATLVGWAIALTAGPVAAIDLWGFRERGRRAGLLFFGSALSYYVIGLFTLRSPTAPVFPILLAIVFYAIPSTVLLLSARWFRTLRH